MINPANTTALTATYAAKITEAHERAKRFITLAASELALDNPSMFTAHELTAKALETIEHIGLLSRAQSRVNKYVGPRPELLATTGGEA
jgi:hypothetical protein